MHLIDKSNAELKHDSIFCFGRILSDESSHMSAKVGQHLLSKKGTANEERARCRPALCSFVGLVWGKLAWHHQPRRVKYTGFGIRHLSTNAKMPITSAKGKVPASSLPSVLVPRVGLIFNGSTFQTTRDQAPSEKSRSWRRENGPKDLVQ